MNLPNPYESPQVDPRDTSDPDYNSPPTPIANGERWELLHMILLVISALCTLWFHGAFRWRLHGMDRLPLRLIVAAMLIVSSGAIAAILLAAVRKWQGRGTFPVHFGHWLLIIGGTNLLVYYLNEWLAVLAIKAALRRDEQPWDLVADPLAALSTIQISLQLAALIVPCVAIGYARGDRDWQRFALFWACFQLGQIALAHYGAQAHWLVVAFNALCALLMAGTFLMAVINDLRRPRDQLHWIGVAWTVLVIFVFRIIDSTLRLMM